MLIGLDFDQTFDKDPQMWRKFVDLAANYGHQVWIVTARTDNRENREVLEEFCAGLTVVFTNGSPKPWFIQNIFKRNVDVWIDDDPKRLIEGV